MTAPVEEVMATARQARTELLTDATVVPDPTVWERVTAPTGQPVTIQPGVVAALDDLLTVAHAELMYLWTDYASARQRAYNGRWSISCEELVGRIVNLTLIVGPCPWQNVPEGPLRDGTYRALHIALGIDPGIDDVELGRFLTACSRERLNALRRRG